jgi:hypothetical protein
MVWRTLTDYERLAGAHHARALTSLFRPDERWAVLTHVRRARVGPSEIVPSLDENRILERWAGGVRLLQVRACRPGACLSASSHRANPAHQVAAQELAWGLKFSATATLDIEEMPNGLVAAQREGCAPVLLVGRTRA